MDVQSEYRDQENDGTYRPTVSPPPSPPEDRSDESSTRLFAKRWLILIIFCSLSMSNAFQWIEYAIISSIVVKYYDVSELAISWTSMIYMLAYIPLVFPATWLLDKYGLRLTALLGSCGNCIGAWIKCGSAAPGRFWVTFLGQTVVGTSQIFILGLPPRLAAIWFGPKEVSTACSLGVFGNQLGIAIGFLLPPMIVDVTVPMAKSATNYTNTNKTDIQEAINKTFESNGTVPENVTSEVDYQMFYETVSQRLLILFIVSAVINSVVFLLVIFFFSDKPKVPPSLAQLASIEAGIEKNYFHSLKLLILNRNFILLVITYGINTGVFYAVSTILNQVLTKYFPGEEINIGRIGLCIILAGMAGSIVCGFWLDRTKMFRGTVLTVYFLSFIGMILYTSLVDVSKQLGMIVMFFVAGFLGFFMTGYLPLGFEFAIELTYPTPEGTSSGLLNASAQVFGIILTTVMTELNIVSVLACNISLSLCLAVGTVLTYLIRPDLRRQQAETKGTPSTAKLLGLENGQQQIESYTINNENNPIANNGIKNGKKFY